MTAPTPSSSPNYMDGAGGALAGLGLGLLMPNERGMYDDYANEIQNDAGAFDPYVNTGQFDFNRFSGAMNHLVDNPTHEIDAISKHFALSPYESQILSHTKDAMNQNSASTGLLGSTAANEALQGQMSGDVGKFQNDYVQQGLGQYDMGLKGLQSDAQMGMNALDSREKMLQEAALGRVQAGKANNQWLDNAIGSGIALGGKAGGFF